MPDDSDCSNCGKTGFKDGEICRVCYGQGILPVRYPFSYLLKNVYGAADKAEAARVAASELREILDLHTIKLDSILSKLEDILSSCPPSGANKVKNIYVDSGKLKVDFDENPEP
jgi:hypothetical protein